MFIDYMQGVSFESLQILSSADGCVMHGIKSNSDEFHGFGEAYFSKVNFGKIKGWKRHKRMTLNLIVPHGEIQFSIYDGRMHSKTNGSFTTKTLSFHNYGRLTIEPNLWVAFKGLAPAGNIVLNVANIEHSPDEAEHVPLSDFKCDWRAT